MKLKLVVIVLMGLVLFVSQFIVTKAIQPEVASELALEQFANPSVETDTASRMIDIVQPIFGFVFAAYVLGSLLWVAPNVLRLFRPSTPTPGKEGIE